MRPSPTRRSTSKGAQTAPIVFRSQFPASDRTNWKWWRSRTLLTVSGSKAGGEPQATYLHQGISTRSFERRFPLADFVIVQSAALENGLLTITLKREVPEAMKPRKLDISTTAQPASTTEKDQTQAQA